MNACARWTENNDCACMSTCMRGVVVYAMIRRSHDNGYYYPQYPISLTSGSLNYAGVSLAVI